MNITYSHQIDPRPVDLGGGWRLRLIEDGEEVGGGVFPMGKGGYTDAVTEGEEWLTTRPPAGEKMIGDGELM